MVPPSLDKNTPATDVPAIIFPDFINRAAIDLFVKPVVPSAVQFKPEFADLKTPEP